jgi:hypothetical protein
MDFLCRDHEPPHTHGQAEASRTRAAWVEKEDAVSLFNLRPMAMAVNHHAKSSCLGFQIDSSEVVQHINRHARDFDYFRRRQSRHPGASIDIPANRGYRRDVRELFENSRIAHIAGVEDAVGSAQGLDGLGTQQAVSVGDLPRVTSVSRMVSLFVFVFSLGLQFCLERLLLDLRQKADGRMRPSPRGSYSDGPCYSRGAC